MRAPYTERRYAELTWPNSTSARSRRVPRPRAASCLDCPHRAISSRRCALGEYPYPAVAHSNYFVLLQTIINDPAPQLPAGACATCHPPPTHHTATARPAAESTALDSRRNSATSSFCACEWTRRSGRRRTRSSVTASFGCMTMRCARLIWRASSRASRRCATYSRSRRGGLLCSSAFIRVFQISNIESKYVHACSNHQYRHTSS